MKWLWIAVGTVVGVSVTSIAMTLFVAWIFKDAE